MIFLYWPYNYMSNHFKGFDFTELANINPDIRKEAEEKSRLAMQHPLEYLDFLTREIVATNDEGKAYLGLSVLKMVITEVRFPNTILLQVLEYYSNLYSYSKKESFIGPFSAFLQALLVQVDLQPQKTVEQNEREQSLLLSRSCYLNKENMLLQGPLNNINVKLLLSFLSIYLEHIIQKNISLMTIRHLSFKLVYQKVKSIKFEGNVKQMQQLKKAKANFLVLMLLNTRKISANVMIQYFSIIPKQVCEYGIEMMRQKLINLEKMNVLFSFFLKNIIYLKTEDALKFLGEQIETHISFGKLLGLIITEINNAQFPINSVIEDEGQSTRSLSSGSDEQIPITLQQYSNQKVHLEDHSDALYFWFFKVLLTHNTTKEVDIFQLADPLESAFQNLFFQNDEANSFVQWMMNRYLEGTKGDPNFQNFCFYFYYMQGHFFNSNILTEIKQKVGIMALQDLKSLRFSKNKDMCSVLYYLRVFLGSNLPPQNFHSEAITIIMQLFQRFNCNEFSQAILTCFTRSVKNQEYKICQVTNSIWPLISTIKPTMKQHVLRSIRNSLEQEENIDTYFVSDLLNMINQNSIVFEDFYLKEAVYVRVQYLRLISVSIYRLIELRQNISEIASFLERLVRRSPKDSLEICEILEIFAAIFYRQNKKAKVSSILPYLSVINILINEFRFLAKDIKLHQHLLLQIASLPYSKIQIEQAIAVNKLQTYTLEYLLSFELNDQLCDVLEVFFTLNEAAITEAVTACVLAKTLNSPNYFRMVYLLSPRPYPSAFKSNFEFTELKHYKWAVLFIIGKYQPPSFQAISRAPRDQTSELIQQLQVMGTQLSSDEFYSLMMLRDKLDMFSKDDQDIWLSGIDKSAAHNTFSQLYQEKYRRCSLNQAIKKFLKRYGYDLE